jgi:hypothetical protein
MGYGRLDSILDPTQFQESIFPPITPPKISTQVLESSQEREGVLWLYILLITRSSNNRKYYN